MAPLIFLPHVVALPLLRLYLNFISLPNLSPTLDNLSPAGPFSHFTSSLKSRPPSTPPPGTPNSSSPAPVSASLPSSQSQFRRFPVMSDSTASARETMEDASIKVQEKTRGAIETVKQSGFVQQYILPVVNWLRDKYTRSPMVLKLTMMTFIVLSAIPFACFCGFMGVVTLGCLIVGGIAFTIVEGGFAMFASAFLLPALGLVLLITGALGLFGLVIYTGYRVSCYVINVILGPGQKRDIQQTLERAPEKIGRFAGEPGSSTSRS